MNAKKRQQLATQRKKRVRGKVRGTAQRPRLSVFRSNKHTYLQVIDDDKGVTIAASNDAMLSKGKAALKGTKIEKATLIAQSLVEQLKKQKVAKLAFDRGSYRYHGRLHAVAEVIRAAGIQV